MTRSALRRPTNERPRWSRAGAALACACVVAAGVGVHRLAKRPSASLAESRGSSQARTARPVAGEASVPESAPEAESDDPVLITAEPSGSTVVMGVVVERDGTPAAGATVVIDTVPGRGVIADDAGRFRFERLLSRDYQVVATKEDRLSEPTPARGQEGGDVRVVLAPAAQLTVSVVDAVDAQPVPHAVVRAEAPYELRGETDSLGRSVLRPLGRGEYRVSVRASGYATAIRQISVRGSNRPLSLVIRLEPGIDLSGQVVDSEGAGVSEARVTLMDGRRGVAGGVVLDSAWSEADGTFRFTAPPSAKIFVTAHHFHFAPARSDLVTVAEGASARVRVVMKAGAELDGSVVDRHGSPIASARVTVESDAGELFTRRECLSDSTGRFLLTGLPTGRVIASAAIDSASSRRYSLPLLPGVRKQLEIMLDREGTISGRVVSAGGGPVAGAVVNVRSRTDEASRSDRKIPSSPTRMAISPSGRSIRAAIASSPLAPLQVSRLALPSSRRTRTTFQ